MEVIPGIYQLKVPLPNNPLGDMNSYLIRSGGRTLLIDTGWPTEDNFASLLRNLAEVGAAPRDLDQIAITHIHVDHYGLASRLKSESGAELIMSETEGHLLGDRYLGNGDFLGQTEDWLGLNGVPADVRHILVRSQKETLASIPVCMPDRVLRHEEHLRVGDFDFEVLLTPGHSPGHICFYERDRRILISGDHVLPDITPNISMHGEADGNPLADYLKSLRATENLPVDLVLPAHRRIFHDLLGRTQEICAHHEERIQHVIKAMGGHSMTGYDVAGAIPWDTKGVPWTDLPPTMKRIAFFETMSHIHLMRTKHLLTTSVRDGVLWNRVA